MADKISESNSGDETDEAKEEKRLARRRELLGTLSVRPEMRHSVAALGYTAPIMGEEAQWSDLTTAYQDQLRAAERGEVGQVSRMLMAQALTLDSIFTRMAERAAANMGHHSEAVKQYTNMALRAQANSRATLEALARIHQPREQIVKHVNVNEGGQAVFANQIHQNRGKGSDDDRPGADGERATRPHEPSTPMLGQNQEGNGVPVPGDEGQEAVSAARREVPGRSDRSG